MQGGP